MSPKLILAVVATMLALVSLEFSDGFADEPVGRPLFRETDLKTLDLTDAQLKRLDRLKKSPATIAHSIVKIDLDLLKHPGEPILLKSAIGLNLEIKGAKVESKDHVKHLMWSGKDVSESVMLTTSDQDVTGLIYAGKKVYLVEPLGGGLHATVLLDQTKFPPDEPKSFNEMEREASEIKAPKLVQRKQDPTADATPLVLRVLVAYTPKVEELVANVPLLVDSAVSITNTSYKNSQIDLRIELAHIQKVTYNEAGLDTDLSRFTNTNDGVMDDVHSLRDQHQADVCILLIDTSEACGKAAAILAKESNAFCVVAPNCAVANLSFAHEIGHLQGARHNPEVDPTSTPFPHGHGYLNPGGNWRTIMAYPTAQNPTRVPYWSNPNVNYPPTSEVMGTSTKHNNAKVLNETGATVTAFRPK